MILYHGSNVEIEAVDFLESKVGKDFGVGLTMSSLVATRPTKQA